jgi:transposase-like protein
MKTHAELWQEARDIVACTYESPWDEPVFTIDHVRAAVSMAESAMSDRADRDKFVDALRRQNCALADQVATLTRQVTTLNSVVEVQHEEVLQTTRELARLRSPMQEE